MEPTPPAARRLSAWAKCGAVLGAAVLLLAAGVGGWALIRWANRPREETGTPSPSTTDPRRTWDTPYRNVRPEVKYVGDAACGGCHVHDKECASYRQHPMGRSFAPLAAGTRGTAAHFEKAGIHFLAEERDGHVFHKARRADADGKTLYEVEARADFVMGSGQRGRSYLVNRDGHLYQSPLSWYSQPGVWDLSPGFRPEWLFDRPVTASCLFCHCNDADAVKDTINAYRPPIFRSHAIGCERCHGPGELHVADPADASTIVHPGKLPPALREDVCNQCHFQGKARVVCHGRDVFDYRPGLPLPLFWSLFVAAPELKEIKAVGHVEQMRESRCFQASQGKLGCISCHDPHALPKPDEKAAYYRGRCLSCHTNGPQCSVPEPERRRQDRDDSCIACHMPRLASTDIAHTATTDHTIPRKPAAPDRSAAPRVLPRGQLPVVYFEKGRGDHPGEEEVSRDLGLALIELGRKHIPDAGELGRLALPLLNEATRSAPDDLAALEGKGNALMYQRRYAEALAAFEAVLERSPRHESALSRAALLALGLGRNEKAAAYGRRAVDVNPWSAEYRVRYAQALKRLGEWQPAAEQCRAALRLQPADRPTRQLLIECLLTGEERELARMEFATLLALTPGEEKEALRLWFQDQLGRGMP